jgi:predicted nucleic acid-binding protein
MMVRIYLDTNIFIEAFEKDGPLSDCARAVLHLVRSGVATGVLSELIVAELLVKPVADGDVELHDSYLELLESPSGYVARPVDRDVLIEAARHRAVSRRTKLPDAIHVATAKLEQCLAFVTADKKIDAPDGFAFLDLGPDTAESIRALA